MILRSLLGVVVLVFTMACAQDDPRPSFLLFVFDTTRQDDVSAYDENLNTTPHFDRLARQGRLYTRAFSHAPWTLPSHTSIFTGLLPSQHGVGWRSFQAPDALDTLAERMAAAGYETLAITENPWITPTFNLAQGFEEHFWLPTPDAGTVEGTLEAWLGRRSRRPFFVFVNVTDAHSPYDTGAECDLLPAGVTLSNARTISIHPRDHNCIAREGSREMLALQALHRCSLRLADAKLGAVHALLSSASDRLLSVVTSDHGELFGEDRLISHQFSLRNELLEVPLLAHGLADRTPARIDTPVQLVDIAPSILAWAGIEAGEGLAGRPLPAAGESAEPRAIVSEYADYASLRAETEADERMLRLGEGMRRHCGEGDRVFGQMRSVMEYPYKVTQFERHPAQLVDLAADPSESHDLRQSHTELADDLLSRLPAVGPRAEAPSEAAPEPSPEMLRSLEALGYLEGAGPEESERR
jgi:arylsulfatase A-like enzyme